MSWLKAIVLGVIQGLTEFLPVSSSGHLVMARRLLGVESPQGAAKAVWEVALHVGTLLAVLVVFRREIKQLIIGFFRGLWACRGGVAAALRDDDDFALAVKVGIGTVPAVVVGLGFREFLKGLTEQPLVACVALLVTGGFLFATRYARPSKEGAHVGWLDSLLIGLAQAAAIVPGISRSGATISAGIGLRVGRENAARFSFLLAVPAIAGAGLLECRHVYALPRQDLLPLLVGGLVSAVVGWAALLWLLNWVKKGHLHRFSYYCWAMGLVGIIWFMSEKG